VVRINVDACYVQQYFLRPGSEGSEVTCHGVGSHAMTFNLVSGEALRVRSSGPGPITNFLWFASGVGCPLRSVDSRGEQPFPSAVRYWMY
jgi:hypothetical protein